MKLAKYRIAPGEYRLGEFLILRGGRGWWQVRDKTDTIIEKFETVKGALAFAKQLDEHVPGPPRILKPIIIPL